MSVPPPLPTPTFSELTRPRHALDNPPFPHSARSSAKSAAPPSPATRTSRPTPALTCQTRQRSMHARSATSTSGPTNTSKNTWTWSTTARATTCVNLLWVLLREMVRKRWSAKTDVASPRNIQCAQCGQHFRKHRDLRNHTAEVHAPPGTKPFMCTHPGCTNSFNQSAHLKSHLKTHDCESLVTGG